MTNPFFEPWQNAFGLPPFDLIEDHHFSEAFDRAFEEHRAEISAIALNPEPATFDNTILALEHSGALLEKVSGVFFNLVGSDTNEHRQAIEMTVSAQWSNHDSDLFANTALFDRIESLHQQREHLPLDPDQRQLLATLHQSFVRGGAALTDLDKPRVKAINERLAQLETQFSQNVLKETNEFELILHTPDQTKGLPDSVLAAATKEAEARGHHGAFVFTISRSSITPFLQFAEDRSLREKIYRAYVQCGDNDNAANNRSALTEIANLRRDKAQILGFSSHAEYMLADRMAETPLRVHALLDEIWRPAQKKVNEEAEDLQQQILADGQNFELAPWDWWFYTEKVRAARFDLSEDDIKPYFHLPAVRDGAFSVANKLFGLTFNRVEEANLYHPDVEAYDVTAPNGDHVGLFLVDYFSRPSKRGGAWMSEFRGQSGAIRPIVVNCCNFQKSDPCLLGLDEVATLFHEFGHGLHGLMSQVRYPSQAGTNVKQDFVELPSQIMEHWALEPEVLKDYAKHVSTGQPISSTLIEKIQAANTFNQGFMTTEYLAASYLDLAWHESPQEETTHVDTLEQRTLDRIGLIDTVSPRYKSTYFQHIFAGDHYSAGYYSYIWAEVLDADGFQAFKEKGIFDPDTAHAFRTHILEKGGSAEPMTLYRAFRGRDPEVTALLNHRGLISE